MPTPTPLSQTLTNYARGIAPSMVSPLAEFIAPTVPVGVTTGNYVDFSDKNNMQVVDTSRALGGRAKRIGFADDAPSFNCKPQALETPVDDWEKEQYGAGDPVGKYQAKIRALIGSARTSHEKKVFDLVNASVSAVGGLGVYSSDSNDPVSEINAQIEAVAKACGMMPNRIIIGWTAWNTIWHNTKVADKLSTSSDRTPSIERFASLLMTPLDVRLSTMMYDSAKFGKAKSANFVISSDLYLFFGQDNPSEFDNSFAKTFTTVSGSVDTVRTYREDGARSDIVAIDWSEDIKITNANAIARITVS